MKSLIASCALVVAGFGHAGCAYDYSKLPTEPTPVVKPTPPPPEVPVVVPPTPEPVIPPPVQPPPQPPPPAPVPPPAPTLAIAAFTCGQVGPLTVSCSVVPTFGGAPWPPRPGVAGFIWTFTDVGQLTTAAPQSGAVRVPHAGAWAVSVVVLDTDVLPNQSAYATTTVFVQP